MRHQNVFVFVIETTPGTDATPNLTGFEDADINAHSRTIADVIAVLKWVGDQYPHLGAFLGA